MNPIELHTTASGIILALMGATIVAKGTTVPQVLEAIAQLPPVPNKGFQHNAPTVATPKTVPTTQTMQPKTPNPTTQVVSIRRTNKGWSACVGAKVVTSGHVTEARCRAKASELGYLLPSKDNAQNTQRSYKENRAANAAAKVRAESQGTWEQTANDVAEMAGNKRPTRKMSKIEAKAAAQPKQRSFKQASQQMALPTTTTKATTKKATPKGKEKRKWTPEERAQWKAAMLAKQGVTLLVLTWAIVEGKLKTKDMDFATSLADKGLETAGQINWARKVMGRNGINVDSTAQMLASSDTVVEAIATDVQRDITTEPNTSTPKQTPKQTATLDPKVGSLTVQYVCKNGRRFKARQYKTFKGARDYASRKLKGGLVGSGTSIVGNNAARIIVRYNGEPNMLACDAVVNG